MNEYGYKKVPYEKLNSNIPQGRGMIKWQPMATIPEQYKRIEKILNEQAMVDSPTHDNATLVRLEEELRNSINHEVVLRYWNNGFEVQLDCKIEYVDDNLKSVIVSRDGEIMIINFYNIYEII